MEKLAVVALGGNALLKSGEKGTISDQENNARIAAENLMKLQKRDYNFVITHGNGPQVGNILLANAAGYQVHGVPDMPLDVAVAYSQGFIGYIIEQQMRNVLRENDMYMDIITIVTQVVVNKDDPAFSEPTKPVGPYYTKEDAEKIMKESGSIFKEDARGRGWRKVVASPRPLIINNTNAIAKLARAHHIVIAVGGGGIPVYYEEHSKICGIEAVIDKDLASSLLARQINADKFFILTDVPKVCINFNTPQEKSLDKMTINEAHKYLNEGHFGAGSMGPKVLAAIQFVESTGKDAIITSIERLGVDNGGTRIVFA